MIKLEWDLKDLFKSDEEFYSEIEIVKELLNEIKTYEEIEIECNSLFALLEKSSVIKEKINNILVYGSLRYYKDVKSEETKELKRVAEEFNNDVKNSLKFIDLKILEIGVDAIKGFMISNSELKIYELYIDNLFRSRNHIQDEDTNKRIRDNINAINGELSVYNEMINSVQFGSILVDDEEEILNFSKYAKYVSSSDRDTRCEAYKVMAESFSKYKEQASSIFSNIKGKQIENAKLEKFDSVLDSVLFSENISHEIINALIKSTNSNLYLIQRYLKLKAKLVGVSEAHLYDFNVKFPGGVRNLSVKEAVEIVKSALSPLGEEYLKVADILLNGHIDAVNNEDRHQSIIFSWHTYSFLQFKGNYASLKDLVHELGHIVNYYLSKEKQPYIYEDSTVFVGETASIINEILLNRYLYSVSNTDEEKIFYLSKNIENYFTSVFKQVMYTEFESEIFKARENGELESIFIERKYSEIRKKYYGEFINYEDEDNTEWIRLGKLFRWGYYSYRYATGLLIASNVVNSLVYDKSLSKKEYLEFLSAGSNRYSLDLLKMLNIDLTSEEIINNGFKVLENDIVELEKLLSLKKSPNA